jgi:hypothetical protein
LSAQGLLHPPHWESVFSRASQPSEMSELQSPKPELQPAISHVLETHLGVPFGTKQAFPHPPQLVTVVAVSTSHPSPPLPLQSASVPPHVEMPHWPATQFGTPPIDGHWFVQPPQCSTFADVFVSQPFEGSESQSSKPAEHLIEQAPSAHVAVPLFAEHGKPHAEQFFAFVCVFVSQPFLSSPSQSP